MNEPTEVTGFDDDEPLPDTPIGDVAREITERIEHAPPLAELTADDINWDNSRRAKTEPAHDALQPTLAGATLPAASTKLQPRVTTLASTLTAVAKISDAESYVRVGADLKLVKGLLKEIDATFDPIIAAQSKALDEARAQKKRHADPLLAGEVHGKRIMREWDDEQQRIADEEQKRLEAAELARAHDSRLEEAFDAEVAGRTDEAHEIMQQPVYAAPVSVAKSTPKVDGISHKDNWKGEGTDLAKLVLAAADELRSTDRSKPRVAFTMLAFDKAGITKQAKSLKSELNKVPGVRAWNDRTTSVTA